jgi:excisionase family DNA binding protein
VTEDDDVPDGVEKLLTPAEVAGILSVDKSWVYRAARTGLLPSIRVGRWVRFHPTVVRRFIQQGGSTN